MGLDRRKLARPSNSPARQWYRIQNSTTDTTVAQIDIYDEIDWFWGVSAVDFRNALKALGDGITTIDLHINSPGGDVYEAIAIMNTLRQHDARVVTTVDSLAASSAGFIAVGASDELVMAPNSELMAHLPWALVIGDATDMRKMADDLDRIGANIASIFAARAGGTVDDWMQVLTDETWWSAQEAVDAGLADRVLEDSTAAKSDAGAKNSFDLSVFNHPGRQAAPAPRIAARAKTPQPVEAEVTQGKEPIVASLNESALQKLGLDADADDSAVEAAIDALTEQSQAEHGEPAEPSIEQATQVAAKFGMKVVNEAQYDQMVATVADLSARRDAQIADENEAAIRDALASGRINAQAAQTWRDELARNRDTTLALLKTLPANSAVPVAEIGHGVGDEDSTADAEMAGVYAKVTGRQFDNQA